MKACVRVLGVVFGLASLSGIAFGATASDHAKYVRLRAGTSFVGALQSTIDTGKNKVGDPVRLRLTRPVHVGDQTVVPSDATLRGEVTHVDPAGRVAGGAELTIRFLRLTTPDGRSYPVSCIPFRAKGKGEGKHSAEQIGGGAAAGGLIGGIVGGKKSVLKGAAAGAVVGTGVAVATKGKQIVLPAGQKLKITLQAPVSIRVAQPA